MSLRAGELRHRITITRTTETADGHHGFSESTSTIATRIAAEVEDLSGRTLEQARQLDPRVTHRIRIRGRSGLRAGDTVTYHHRHDDRTLEVVAPPLDADAKGVEMHLFCRQRTSE